MESYFLPYFGQINLESLEDSYDVTIDYNGSKMSLDINFENESMSEALLQSIKNFLESIHKFDNQNKSFIQKDFNEEGETSDYISFYLGELESELFEVIDKDNNLPQELQLLNKLRLVRVGLYPDGKYGTDHFATFDYSIDIDGEPCDYLLVVKTNEKGDLDHITWES